MDDELEREVGGQRSTVRGQEADEEEEEEVIPEQEKFKAEWPDDKITGIGSIRRGTKTVHGKDRLFSYNATDQALGRYANIGYAIGCMVDEKQRAYGDSYGRSGAVLREMYPDGIKPEQYDDMLSVIRIIDKLFRIATDKDALGESPYRDIAGYGVLGAGCSAAVRAERMIIPIFDPVAEYIEECLEVAKNRRVDSNLLYKDFQKWCETSGVCSVTKNVFVDQLRSQYPTVYPIIPFGADFSKMYLTGVGIQDHLNDTECKGREKQDLNPITDYIEENLEIKEGRKVSVRDLYDDYRKWCTEGGYRSVTVGNLKDQIAFICPNVYKISPHGDKKRMFFAGIGIQDHLNDTECKGREKQDLNPVAEYIKENLRIADFRKASVNDLYDDYREWCVLSGYRYVNKLNLIYKILDICPGVSRVTPGGDTKRMFLAGIGIN